MLLRKLRTISDHLSCIFQNFFFDISLRQFLNAYYFLTRPSLSDQVILVDGLWDNPNHFFRLHLLRHSLRQGFTAFGLVYDSQSFFERQTLRSLGVHRLIPLSRKPSESSLEIAKDFLSTLTDVSSFLSSALPYGIPPYVIYDAVLKRARVPRLSLQHDLWNITLALALDYAAYFAKLLDDFPISHIYLSHPWGLPYAVITHLSLSRCIPVTHITSYNESLRLRRMSTLSDYRTPVEHLNYQSFQDLSSDKQNRLSAAGSTAFQKRLTGKSSDINTQRAFTSQSSSSLKDCIPIRFHNLPIGLICFHAWFDFPHTFGMSNFDDFFHWAQVTLAAITQNPNVVWLLKPHPLETWHGGFSLTAIFKDLPANIILLNKEYSQRQCLELSDFVVTVHGTVGIEAPLLNLPVICADFSYYSDWPFAYTASSQSDYIDKLLSLSSSTIKQLSGGVLTETAAACSYVCLSSSNDLDKSLQFRCDSLQNKLYTTLIRTILSSSEFINREICLLTEWHEQPLHSYHVFKAIRELNISES